MSQPGRPQQPQPRQPQAGQLYLGPPYAPGYGAPASAGPWARAAPGMNTMAILAMIFAFVMPVLGIVFGAVARRQIDRSGEEGHGLATAGLVIGVVSCVLVLIAFAAYAVFFVFLVTRAQDPGSHLSPFSSPFPTALGGALGA